MAINQITTAQINSQLQNFYNQLDALQNQANLFFLDVVTNIGLAALQAAPYSYLPADAQAVLNAVTRIWQIFQVLQGLMYVAPGSTQGNGVPTANDGTHFGFPFINDIAKTGGEGY